MFRKLFLLVVSCVAVTACSHNVGLNPQYLQSDRELDASISGSGAVLMQSDVRDSIVSSGPTSYTGSATSLSAPVGLIVSEAAVAAFEDAGLSSIVSISENDASGNFDFIIEPQITSYSYKYDQLSNLGMAVTPKVSLSIRIRVSDADGNTLMNETYTRQDYHRGAYIASFEPHEKVNMTLHEAAFDIMIEAANDLAVLIDRTTSSPEAAPANSEPLSS